MLGFKIIGLADRNDPIALDDESTVCENAPVPVHSDEPVDIADEDIGHRDRLR